MCKLAAMYVIQSVAEVIRCNSVAAQTTQGTLNGFA